VERSFAIETKADCVFVEIRINRNAIEGLANFKVKQPGQVEVSKAEKVLLNL
jgi:hypothetical protein